MVFLPFKHKCDLPIKFGASFLLVVPKIGPQNQVGSWSPKIKLALGPPVEFARYLVSRPAAWRHVHFSSLSLTHIIQNHFLQLGTIRVSQRLLLWLIILQKPLDLSDLQSTLLLQVSDSVSLAGIWFTPDLIVQPEDAIKVKENAADQEAAEEIAEVHMIVLVLKVRLDIPAQQVMSLCLFK